MRHNGDSVEAENNYHRSCVQLAQTKLTTILEMENRDLKFDGNQLVKMTDFWKNRYDFLCNCLVVKIPIIGTVQNIEAPTPDRPRACSSREEANEFVAQVYGNNEGGGGGVCHRPGM